MNSLLQRCWGNLIASKLGLRVLLLMVSCMGMTLFLSLKSVAQSSPADCKTGCTSNDVQIQAAYLSDVNGNKLPQNFICPASGSATVYLTLELTTQTPRVGVVIYDSIRNFTGGVPGTLITVLTQCFPVALSNTAHKVTFSNPFSWTCGTPIVMTGVFIGWGTGNTNFCTGSGFQCPGTSSKCFSLPPGQFIAIQIPSSKDGSETVCADTPGGTTGTFRLDTITVTTSSNVSINYWLNYSGGTLSNCIPTSLITAYSSTSATIYAKIKNNSDTTAFSVSTITLTVNNVSAGSIGSDQTICSGGDPAAFTSVAGTGAGTISYQWQSNTTGCGSSFSNISGQTGATYDVPSGLTTTTYYRRIDTSKINGVACINTSNCVTVTVNNITAGNISSAQTICSGGTPTQLTGTTGSGGGTLSYQWLSNTTGCSGPWSPAAGTNNAQNYQPGAQTLTTYYKRVTTSTLNSAACRDTSNCITITINTVTAGTIGGVQAICSGNTPTVLTNVSAGTGSGYQWLSNTTGCNGPWSTASGTNTNATYQPGALTQTTYYKRVRTNTLNGVLCADTSNCVTVTVNPKPDLVTHNPSPVCSPGTIDLTAAAVTSGSTLFGATLAYYTALNPNQAVSTPGAVGSGTYYIIATTSDGCSDTATVTATVNNTPTTPTVSITEPSLCGTGTASLTVTNPQAGVTYTLTQPVSGGISPAPVTYQSGALTFSGLIPGKGYSVTAAQGSCSSGTASCTPPSITKAAVPQNESPVSQATTVKAYPNPFTNRIKFVVTSPIGGRGNLEVYNMTGQRVKTVYSGFISSGTQTFEMSLPTQQIANLIYVLRIGDKKVSGKILQINQ